MRILSEHARGESTMFVVSSLSIAICFCIVTMLGWGSWANTQKLTGKAHWPFQLFYWDYAIGVLLCALFFAATFGSYGTAGMPALANMHTLAASYVLPALISGVIFNLSNILLVVGIDAAGMAVAFPVGVGLALVLGTAVSYIQSPKGQPALIFGGLALVLAAMILSAAAHSRLPRVEATNSRKGIIASICAGVVMGFFYPQLMRSISPNFNSSPIAPGMLTPYVALVFFAAGVFVSNFLWNTLFMRSGHVTYAEYFRGTLRLHSIGILGGVIWMVAFTFNVIASSVAGPAISYALGQGATFIAALWGLLIWREFRSAPRGTGKLIALMLAGYAIGLVCIGAASM
jgi:glucose uptake protein